MGDSAVDACLITKMLIFEPAFIGHLTSFVKTMNGRTEKNSIEHDFGKMNSEFKSLRLPKDKSGRCDSPKSVKSTISLKVEEKKACCDFVRQHELVDKEHRKIKHILDEMLNFECRLLETLRILSVC
ncbi:hypothetical protein P879_10539 [Paragonimus westermani]|uniref:Uncharacterized protein n=1 Tax=Paragonimus westermani TaxID=34504 RepID=A0A8T0DFY9_9TREM|nr:hypothetical protein P879_10539 [Paragonimus westermani]